MEAAGRMGVEIRDEAAFVSRSESIVATDGIIDPLGFSDKKTVPVIK
jgi:hypothetical protein